MPESEEKINPLEELTLESQNLDRILTAYLHTGDIITAKNEFFIEVKPLPNLDASVSYKEQLLEYVNAQVKQYIKHKQFKGYFNFQELLGDRYSELINTNRMFKVRLTEYKFRRLFKLSQKVYPKLSEIGFRVYNFNYLAIHKENDRRRIFLYQGTAPQTTPKDAIIIQFNTVIGINRSLTEISVPEERYFLRSRWRTLNEIREIETWTEKTLERNLRKMRKESES